jgi:hypothetical protein
MDEQTHFKKIKKTTLIFENARRTQKIMEPQTTSGCGTAPENVLKI